MKVINLVLLLITASFGAFAQNFEGKLIIGANGSQIEGDDLSGYNQAGFVGGAGVEYDFDDTFYWGGQLLYSQRGSQSEDGPPPSTEYRFNYISMPLLIGAKAFEQVHFNAGLVPAYLLSGSNVDNRGLNHEATNRWDYGFQIGVGYEPVERWRFVLRTMQSLRSINKYTYFRSNVLGLLIEYKL